MNERIRKVRRYYRLSQEEFGEKIGVTRDIISNIELGRVEPKALLVNHISVVFNVSKEWLDLGEGDMIASLPKEEYLASLGLSEMGKQIIDTFLELPPEEQTVLENFFFKLACKVKNSK